MNQYQLVFNGTVSDGHNINEVKRNLAALFKTDDTKVEQMFTRLPFVVKRNVDYDGAIKYQRVLRKAGAICQVEEAIQNISPPVREEAAPPPPPLTYKPDLGATDVDYTPPTEAATAPTNSKDSQKKGYKRPRRYHNRRCAYRYRVCGRGVGVYGRCHLAGLLFRWPRYILDRQWYL